MDNMKSERNTICFSSKGQVVIPRRFRKELGIQEGTRAVIKAQNGSLLLTPVTREYLETHYGKYRGKNLLEALAEEKAREKER